jgi:hypothetical protein
VLFQFYRFFRGIFGYGDAKSRQDTIKEELQREGRLQKELGSDAHYQLSRLEQEMKRAEQEDADEP